MVDEMVYDIEPEKSGMGGEQQGLQKSESAKQGDRFIALQSEFVI